MAPIREIELGSFGVSAGDLIASLAIAGLAVNL